jgi:hypothetical protein
MLKILLNEELFIKPPNELKIKVGNLVNLNETLAIARAYIEYGNALKYYVKKQIENEKQIRKH